MTTDTPVRRDRGTAALVRTAAAAALLGLLAALLGMLTSGTAAAYGALGGTVLVVAVLGFGTVTVNAVAALLPAASLLVAMLTYTLQVVAMALAFVALSGSGLLEESVDRTWLGGTVIAGTLLWTVVQIVLSTSRRIPIYELPERRSAEAESMSGEGRDR